MWGRGCSWLKERSDRVVTESQDDPVPLDIGDVAPDAGNYQVINLPDMKRVAGVSGTYVTPVHQATSTASRFGRHLPS